MDLQETIVLRIQRERESHLATNYVPEGLQRTTHASSERHQWKWWTPLWWCLDWIWWFWTLRRLDEYFIDASRVSTFLGIYRAKRRSGGTRGGHNPPGRARASWRALVGCPLLGTPPRCNQGPLCSFWPIKNHRGVSWHLESVWYWFPAM